MISPKQAAEKAAVYLKELIQDADDIRLEEVDSSDSQWRITLSFWQPYGPLVGMRRRAFKVFDLSKDSGEVLSMKVSHLVNV